MASYSTMSTIPAADVETEQPLLKRDVKLNVKTVLAGAAGAAFILGAAAATAVTASAAPKQMSLGAQYYPKAVNIELGDHHSECVMFSNEGTPLRVKGCSKHGGQYRQVLNVKDNTVKYESFVNDRLTGDCLTLLGGGSEFGISTCSDKYDAWQSFEEDGSYVTQLKLAAQDLCASVQGKDIIAEPCDGSSAQTFRTLPSHKSNIRHESLPKGYWGDDG